LAAESAKARHLHDKLAESKSAYASLEVQYVKADCRYAKVLSAMEDGYASQVSSLEDELKGVVTAGRAACQAAYAQPEGPSSVAEVVSQLGGIPKCLEKIAQYGLSTGAHMALVIVRTIYTNLDISTIKGKPTNTNPLLYK
jgi:hypothetical protein